MTFDFEFTKKRGRHFYAVVGIYAEYRLLSGELASEDQTTAIARGDIQGLRNRLETRVASIETGVDSERAVWREYSKWTMIAKPEDYGGRSKYDEFAIRRS